MRIDRILNNNVVIIKDENGEEQVVCGKGIAYKKKAGDLLSEKLINKVFVLKDTAQKQHFQEIISEIPVEYIQITTEIVEMLTQTLERKLNEAIYISLSDHIYMAITRYLDGVVVKNSMLWDIKRFYEKEYQAAKKVWKMINQTFKVELPEDEIGFITLHIVNAEMDNENLKQTMEVTKLMHEISNIVRYYFSVEFNTESVYYYRFITHLKFFAQRLLTDKEYEDDQDNELFNTIRQKYRTSYKCVEKIAEFISRKYEKELSDEEKLYLTIHIERVIYKSRD